MRSNLYLSVRGILENGETVDEEFQALEGVMFVTADPEADAPAEAMGITNGLVGTISQEMLMGALLAVRKVVGPWRLLWMALRAAERGERIYVDRKLDAAGEGGEGE